MFICRAAPLQRHPEQQLFGYSQPAAAAETCEVNTMQVMHDDVDVVDMIDCDSMPCCSSTSASSITSSPPPPPAVQHMSFTQPASFDQLVNEMSQQTHTQRKSAYTLSQNTVG